MIRSLGLITICLLLFRHQADAQKTTEVRDQLWLGYFNQTRLTQRSGVWMDLHSRFTNHFIRNKSQQILRFGYTYYVTDEFRLTVGYAYVNTYGQNGSPDVPEHRPWVQAQWYEKKPGLSLMQWLRIEERYRRKIKGSALEEGYNFNWRFRYNFSFQVPLNGKTIQPKTPFLFLSDELFINAGKQITFNYFDQNRLAAGFGYQWSRSLNFQLAYMNVFQQLPSGNHYASINSIRLFVYQNLDFRKSGD